MLETDSVAGRSMALRSGAGKVRHLDIKLLWVRGVFILRRVPFETSQVPGVRVTKFLDSGKIAVILKALDIAFARGRSELAWCAALQLVAP